MMQQVGIDFANSNNILLGKLRTILQTPQFCGEKLLDLRPIISLLNELNTNITFVIEYPYVDSHYRDTFYFYHSAKFEEYYRNCIRVHLFLDFFVESIDSLLKISHTDQPIPDAQKQKYAGFFIVRPLSGFPLGRSLLAPVVFKKHDFVCCLMRSRVSLLGLNLEVYGFPHVAQDTETHTCAESSLWSLFEYLGHRYSQYLPLLPSQILHNLSNVSDHRPVPSEGLTINEISKSLCINGCDSIVDKADDTPELCNFRLFLLKIYIESGIPVYLALEDKDHGHAVLAVGHENTNDINFPLENWQDISYFKKSIVLIDDNMPPYQIGKLDSPISYNPDYKIRNYFVPLPRHTNLDAQRAFFLAKYVFNDPRVGLKTFGEKWITRLLLTGSHSFKYFLLTHSGLDENIKRFLLQMAFPKFIWLCEIYRPEEFRQGLCSGLLLLDSTGTNSFTSILWYNVGNKQMRGNGLGWTGIFPIKPFKMATYRHNLKGEWSEWKI
jgi:hypothetical protein